MKVSKTSWHYRLYNFWANFYERGADTLLPARWREHPTPTQHYPTSLCGYFWTIVCLTLLSVPAILVGAPAIFLLSYLGLGINLGIKAYKRRRKQEPGKSRRKATPKLVVSYIKARKQKVCPLIQLTD